MRDQAKPSVNIVGVYVVSGEISVHLVELIVRGSVGVFDLGSFTQEIPDQPDSNWQVAYDERFLDKSGLHILFDGTSARGNMALWMGDVRLAFFFHFIDFNKPLKTPFGDVEIPKETTMPTRLSVIEYEPPC